jgi:hypothetical protein
MTDTPNRILVGRTITAVYLAEDKKAIRFDVAGGDPIIAKADGDCCSSTWIENIENAEALIGTPVLSASDISMREDQRDDDGLIQFYGFKISTAKGDCILDYRNESNGYYGGNLSWPGDGYFYGGVFGQNVSKEEWREVAR